jgi:short-subunit dehydrogenase
VGAFHVLQACAKAMATQGGGAIVQTGSVAGLRGTPTMAAYVASKVHEAPPFFFF